MKKIIKRTQNEFVYVHLKSSFEHRLLTKLRKEEEEEGEGKKVFRCFIARTTTMPDEARREEEKAREREREEEGEGT